VDRRLDARLFQDTVLDRPGESNGAALMFDDDKFGDNLTLKKSNCLRNGFQNIGDFPREKNKLKEGNIKVGLSTWDFDIFGIAETNTD
jgi:hypothetical protein